MSTQLSSADATSLVSREEEALAPDSSNYLPVMVVSAILAVAHLPMLVALCRDLWSRSHYQFFPFVIIGSGFLLYEGLRRLKQPLRGGNQAVCFGLILFAGALLVLSSLAGSGTLAAIATLVSLGTVAYGVGSWTLVKIATPAWILLWLMVPPPFKLDTELITNLQWWVSWANGKVCDFFRIEHVVYGAVIQIPGQQLLVEEACSGIHSLFSTIAFTLFFVLWVRRGIIHSILLLLAALYWVLLGNLLRIFLITIAEVFFDYNLVAEPQHSFLSVAIFGLDVLLVWSTDSLLLFLSPWGARAIQRASEFASAPASRVTPLAPDIDRTWLASWTVGLVFALIATVQFWLVGSQLVIDLTRESIELAEIGAAGLTPRILGSQQVGHKGIETREVNNINGEHSQSWTYWFNGKYPCQVSLDYTFTGWHDLTICYTNGGWTIEPRNRKIAGDPQPDGTVLNPFMQVEMNKHHLGESGFLCFSIFKADGERFTPPTTRSRKLLSERIAFIVKNFKGGNKDLVEMTVPTYQVQMLIQCYGELTPEEKALAVQTFREIESQLRVAVAKSRLNGSESGPAPVPTPPPAPTTTAQANAGVNS